MLTDVNGLSFREGVVWLNVSSYFLLLFFVIDVYTGKLTLEIVYFLDSYPFYFQKFMGRPKKQKTVKKTSVPQNQ